MEDYNGLKHEMEKIKNKKKKHSFIIYESKIPISSQLKKLIKKKKLKKLDLVSNGEEYQILFKGREDQSRIIIVNFNYHLNFSIIVTSFYRMNSAF